jgi:hypothetical protein
VAHLLHFSPVLLNLQEFGLGVALQTNASVSAPTGEVSWGGAASTNWFLSTEADSVIVCLTQVLSIAANDAHQLTW